MTGKQTVLRTVAGRMPALPGAAGARQCLVEGVVDALIGLADQHRQLIAMRLQQGQRAVRAATVNAELLTWR